MNPAAEHQVARLLMLKAVLTLCVKNVMKDDVRADTVLVHHLVNAKLRVEELLRNIPSEAVRQEIRERKVSA